MTNYNVSVYDAVRDQYDRADAEVARLLREMDTVSCVQGCAGCCHQLIFCGLSEALFIVGEIAKWPDWRDWLRRLFRSAQQMFADDLNTASWFRRAIPCAFLRLDRTCTIYERRPPVCRYHFVTSPRENCMPGAVDDRVWIYDTRLLALRFWELNLELQRSNPDLVIPLYGPLPAMILLAWSKATNRNERYFADKKLARLPPLSEWMRPIMRSVDF